MILLLCAAQAIKAMWIHPTVCVGLRLPRRSDIGCHLMFSMGKHPRIRKVHTVSKVKVREIERIKNPVFLSDSILFSLCYVTIACRCLLLAWKSTEVAKSFMHCRGATTLCLSESTFFSVGVFLRPDLEGLKG